MEKNNSFNDSSRTTLLYGIGICGVFAAAQAGKELIEVEKLPKQLFYPML